MCIGDESIFDYISTPTHDQNIFIKITPHAFLKSFYIFHIKRSNKRFSMQKFRLSAHHFLLFDFPLRSAKKLYLSNFKLVQNSFYIFSRLNKRFFRALYLTFRHFYSFLRFSRKNSIVHLWISSLETGRVNFFARKRRDRDYYYYYYIIIVAGRESDIVKYGKKGWQVTGIRREYFWRLLLSKTFPHFFTIK